MRIVVAALLVVLGVPAPVDAACLAAVGAVDPDCSGATDVADAQHLILLVLGLPLGAAGDLCVDACTDPCAACGCGEECQGGQCVFTACAGKACGSDGCGGSCGSCGCGTQ